MVETFSVILRRQWTDKLMHQSLPTTVPRGVHVTKSADEVILQMESRESDDLCEAVNIIKRLVVEQLVGSGRSTTVDMKRDKEMSQEYRRKGAPVDEERNSSLEDEKHDLSQSGTAKVDSGKDDNNKKEAKQEQKEGSQRVQHRGPAMQLIGHSTTEGSELEGEGDTDGKAALAKIEVAHYSEKVAQEMDDEQEQKGVPVEDRKTPSLENEDRSRPGIAKNDSGKTKRDRKDVHQSETKKNQNGVSHPEQHRSASDEARRQIPCLSAEDSKPDDEDSHDEAATCNETASAAESVQTSTGDTQGMQARTRNTEPCKNHPNSHIDGWTERLQDNAEKTKFSTNDDDKPAAFSGTQEKYRVPEPIWAYIQFIDPESQWDKKLSETKQGNDVVELTGSSADINMLKTFCDTSRLQRAVVRKMQRVPENFTAKIFRDNILELGLSRKKVLIRLTNNDPHYCEFVGKGSDMNDLEKAISDMFPELVEKEQTPDIQQQTTLTGPASVTNEAASHLSAETTKQMSDAGLEFQTERSQLRVRIVTGDLLEWRCEVLVDSCDADLSHAGGLSWSFAKAAGPKMQAECDTYKRKHGRLLQCKVMDTGAGDLPPPIRRIIHAHGPDTRSYRDPSECSSKLQTTFLNCLVHANDSLRARSIAVPALSSGTSLVRYF